MEMNPTGSDFFAHGTDNKSEEQNYQNLDSENYGASQFGEDFAGQESEEPAEKTPSQPLFRGAIRWMVYVAAFLVPLWFLPWTFDVSAFNKQTLLIVAAGVSLVLWLVDIIRTGIVRFKSSVFYLPIFGLVAAGAISVIFSVSRATSLFGVGASRSWPLISLAALAMLFTIAVNVIEDRGKMLRKVMIVSLALSMVYGVLQIFGFYIFKNGVFAAKAFNSVGGLNTLGFLAAFSLAFLAPISFSKREASEYENMWFERASEAAKYIGLALSLFLVIFINWWPVWVAAFSALIASVAFASASDSSLFRRGRMRLFAMPMAVIVLGIFLMLIKFDWTSLKSQLPLEAAPSHGVSWDMALDSLKTRPLGFGLENFGIAYDKFKPASVANSIFYQLRFTDASSEAANLIVEGGVLMLLAFLLLLWFYTKKLAVSVKNGFFGRADSGATWAASFGLIVTFFLYPFNFVLLTVFFLLLILAVLSETGSGEEKVINLESNAKYSFAGSVSFIVGLALVLVAGYFTVNNYIANIYLARASRTSDRNKSIEYYVASANTNGSDARAYRLLSQTILAQLADELNKGPSGGESRESYNSRIQNFITSAVNVSTRAVNANPADSQNWVNQGLVYQNLLTLVGGVDQAAINSYNESLTRNPNDPVTYFRIGNIHLRLADDLITAVNRGQAGNITAARQQINENLAAAEENFTKAVSLYNNYGQALYNLAAVYDRQGNLLDAIRQFERLRSANPRDPSIAFQIGLLYYRNGQKENAFQAWQQAVTLFPNYSNARWYLSLIYEERGDLARALEQVREIEKFNNENELVKQRLEQLEAGQRVIPPGRLLDQEPLDQ